MSRFPLAATSSWPSTASRSPTPRTLPKIMDQHQPGDTITVTFYRGRRKMTTPRHPRRSPRSDGLMTHWTAASIPSQRGKLAYITGANSGVGFHAALELARAGADVILACRDRAKAKPPRPAFAPPFLQPRWRLPTLDLASLASVRARGPAIPRLRPAARSAHQQRRRDGSAAAPRHSRRLRAAARHQPLRPLRADRTSAARAAGRARRAHRHGELDRPPRRHAGLRQSQLGARLQALARLPPHQARESALCF